MITKKNMASFPDNTCCVCEEVYNLEERKPLLLPCSHSFCRSCLQQLKSTNNELCPVCRGSWAGQSVDSLPLIRQLAGSSDELKTFTKNRSAIKQDICSEHDSDNIAWCNICNVSACIKCLKINHKPCDWVTIEEKKVKLFGNLQESVISTRIQLIEKFTLEETANNYQLNDIRDRINKMQQNKETLVTFAKELSTKQELAMNLLEDYENIPSDASVHELSTTISKTLSLLDDPKTEPKKPKLERKVAKVSSNVTTTSGVVRK